MEPLNQLSDLVRSRLGDVPSGCIIRRVMVIVDRGMMIRSNGPKAFASIDFGFDVGTAPDEHNSVRYSPPPFSELQPSPPRMFGDLNSSTISSEVREDTVFSKPNLSLDDSCFLPQVQE